jgi:cellulose synthase/poly-beta-1,6-N-acetylglucosamine synthase-like glycosyltransferase
MIFWTYFSYILTLGYFILIAFFFVGLLAIIYRTKKSKSIEKPTVLKTYSIVIAARNEEHFISKCLESITNQNYDKNKFEIIVINDHSTDKTLDEILAFKIQSRKSGTALKINIIDLEKLENINNKKQAITKGINDAIFDYIILTDADCVRGNLWLQSINDFINISSSKLVYAPVEFKAKNVFEKLQALEFVGLVGVGAAAMELKNPNMCSAANLIFEKQVFFEVNGYTNNEHIMTGDDEFLMHKIFKKYPKQVKFLFDKNAIVETGANGTLGQLTEQRKRWVSKSTKYENRYITLILVMAYLFNLSIFLNLFIDWHLALNQLLFKMLIEGLFLFTMLKLYDKKTLIILLPIAEIFHILYVIIIGIMANFATYTWKERTHN